MFNPFRFKRKKFSTVAKISRIEPFYHPEKDQPLEILYFSDSDYPCINLALDSFQVGDYVQFYPKKC